MAKKSAGVAYGLWAVGLFGILGFHRMYLGRVGSGIFWLLSFGVLGIGALVDLFLIPGMASDFNRELRRDRDLDTLRATAQATASRELKAAKKKKVRAASPGPAAG